MVPHRRTPASRSLSSLTFTPCIETPPASNSPTSISSSNGMSRRVPAMRSTSPLLPRRVTDQGVHLHPDSAAASTVRVKRSCSTSALSSLSISSIISDSPCIRNITQKSTIVEPSTNYACSDNGSMSSRSRSSSASTLNEQLFGHHHATAFLSRRSMTVSTSASSTSAGDYDRSHDPWKGGGYTPLLLSPTSPVSPISDASTPSPPPTVKRGRSHTSAASSTQMFDKFTPAECIRHVASLGKLSFHYPSSASAPGSPSFPSSTRRFALEPIASMSPEPVSTSSLPSTPASPYIKQITVSYPSENGCNRQCKKLFLALEHLQKSPSTPSTPLSAKRLKSSSSSPERSSSSSLAKQYAPPAFRCSARLITEGKCRVDVVYSSGSSMHLDPEACTYDELLAKLGLQAYLASALAKKA